MIGVNNFLVDGKNSVGIFVYGKEEVLSYVDAYATFSQANVYVNKHTAQSNTLIIGNNGIPKENYLYSVSEKSKVIYSSREIMEKSKINISSENSYYNALPKNKLEFLFE